MRPEEILSLKYSYKQLNFQTYPMSVLDLYKICATQQVVHFSEILW